MEPRSLLPLACSLTAAAAVLAAWTLRGAEPRPGWVCAPAPERLSETGLFVDGSGETLAPGLLSFAPQYPLWSDGATKRRWLYLPPGRTIDARDPDCWSFPVGTKFWKEFSFERRVETRYIERGADGEWIFATYVWPADGGEARRAPDAGLRAAATTSFGTLHDLPSLQDCRACHAATPSFVLGFSALQLGPQRDPLAPHAELPPPGAVGVVELLEAGLLRGDPQAILAAARPIDARSPRERAALGYLAANCGGCHNGRGPLASLGLELDHRTGAPSPALRTALLQPSRFQLTGLQRGVRLDPQHPAASVLEQRMASRFGPVQMPPLGTRVVDQEALDLIREWIHSDLATTVAACTEHL